MLKPVTVSQPLFNANHTLNVPEALARIDYWTEYMRTGAPADIERGLSCLTILHKGRETAEFVHEISCGKLIFRLHCLAVKPRAGLIAPEMKKRRQQCSAQSSQSSLQ